MATKAKAPKATPQAPATQAPAEQAIAAAVQALATPAAPAQPAAPAVWAQAPWAATLPRSLVAKGAGLTGAPKGIPASMAGHYVVGNGHHTRAQKHNLAWATHCVALASQPGGTTVEQMLAPVAGQAYGAVGLHSVVAYIKRGWLVPAPQA